MAVTDQEHHERYSIYCGDAMEVMPTLPDGCIHLSIYSPPFARLDGGALYHYSSSDRDLSNCDTYDQFFEMYGWFVKEIHRLTMPGRMTAVHCADVPSGNTGNDWLIEFSSDIRTLHTECKDPACTASRLMKRHGACGHGLWRFVGRYCVWKEPLGVRNRTMAKTLAHKTIVDDGSRCSNAAADYVLVFRRKGENPAPIEHPTGFTKYAGEREMPHELIQYRNMKGDQKKNRYSHWIWRAYASAFWDDIRLNRVLPYREAKDEEDEKHVHPLQLDVIDRILTLWSNPGETVLTPFMGVGSEVYEAVAEGRRGIGIELKPSYYRQAKKNVQHALIENRNDGPQMSLLAIGGQP